MKRSGESRLNHRPFVDKQSSTGPPPRNVRNTLIGLLEVTEAVVNYVYDFWLQDEMRVLHYTVNKPFLYDSTRPVPLERLEERVREAAEEFGGVFREEMVQWGDMWRETRRVYANQLRECMIP